MINKNVFNKTKYSLIKINIAVVVSFLIIFSMFIFSYFKGLTYNNVDKNLKVELENIHIQLNNRSIFYPITLNDPRNMVYVYEGDKIRYYTQNGYFENIVPKTKEHKDNGFYTYKENRYTFRVLSLMIGKYKIQIIRNIDSEMSSFNQLIFVFLIGIVLAVIMTYFIALYLTKKALVPIENAWNNQAKFIQDASHELRTPITIISSKLETMLKYPQNTINDEVETIAQAMKETRKLRKMIDDLLCLTKEDSISKVVKEEVDINELLNQISEDYIDIAQIQNKKLNVRIDIENKNIFTDKNKLRQLIIIFIDNAFKYTSKNDEISIDVYKKGSDVVINIIDTGIGIKQEELPYIFDRFFRSEDVRSKDIDGTGIGLSIAKMLSLNLNIKINTYSELNKYTRFEIIIPIK